MQIKLERGIVNIDEPDLGPMMEFSRKWNIDNNGYVACFISKNKKNAKVYLHRWILGLHRKEVSRFIVVDHINHDRSDNRKSNLRVCNMADNAAHRKYQKKKGSSRFIGVAWHKKNKRWEAYAYRARKTIYLGQFDTQEEAAKARDSFVQHAYRGFATLNVVGN